MWISCVANAFCMGHTKKHNVVFVLNDPTLMHCMRQTIADMWRAACAHNVFHQAMLCHAFWYRIHQAVSLCMQHMQWKSMHPKDLWLHLFMYALAQSSGPFGHPDGRGSLTGDATHTCVCTNQQCAFMYTWRAWAVVADTLHVTITT